MILTRLCYWTILHIIFLKTSKNEFFWEIDEGQLFWVGFYNSGEGGGWGWEVGTVLEQQYILIQL